MSLPYYILFAVLALAHLTHGEFCEADSLNAECGETDESAPPRATTKSGRLQGNVVRVGEALVDEFLGVPFAEAPVKDLRFKNPLPVSAWRGLYRARAFKPICVSSSNKHNSSEDCLYLNIWSPRGRASGSLRDVLFYIHGGSFNMGTASSAYYGGATLAVEADAVVVSANYRLGFLGFLYAATVDQDEDGHDEDSAPGNMGMRDQVRALEWIKENVAAFGGDPCKVTLFGHSAGAISTGMLMLSPEAQGLFRRAIVQSGSPYSFARPDTKVVAARKSLQLSKYVGCSHPDDEQVNRDALRCLRTIDITALIAFGSEELCHSVILPNPIYGDAFLPQNVAQTLAETSASRMDGVDLLIGVVNDESKGFLAEQMPLGFGFLDPQDIGLDDAKLYLRALYRRKLSADDIERVISHYLVNDESLTSSEAIRGAVLRSYADLYINCPSYFFAKAYATSFNGSNVYCYLLNYKASAPLVKDCPGVCHGEQLPFIFGRPLSHPELHTNADREMTKQIIGTWSSFAKTGSPSAFWTPFTSDFSQCSLYGADPKTNAQGSRDFDKFRNCASFWEPIFARNMNILSL